MTGEIWGVIPARGGSKGIPRKNLRPLAGRPLLWYAVEAARASRMLSAFMVTTDDDEIARLAGSWGCRVIRRPADLGRDDTPMVPVIQHAVRAFAEEEGRTPGVVALLQPTAPLREGRHVDEALRRLLESGAESVVSVAPVPGHHHPDWQFRVGEGGMLHTFGGRPLRELPARRQDLGATYTRNGAVYAARARLLMEKSTLYGDPCAAYVMPPEDSVNIDAEADFERAERRMRERKGADL